MLVSAFGILCGFAVVVFIAASRPGIRALTSTAVVAVLTFVALPAGSLPDPVWSALGALGLAALLLWRPELSLIAAGAAGAAATGWYSLLVAQGLGVWPSLAVVGLLTVAVLVLHWRSERFAPAHLREEALLIVAAFALIVACWPAVEAGYRSATVLTAERVSAPALAEARWALQLSLSLVLLGGLYGYWKRR